MMIKTKTGLHNSVQDAIEAEWKKEPCFMDWLGMERLIRETLREYKISKDPVLISGSIILRIDEIVAAFTKRGNELS